MAASGIGDARKNRLVGNGDLRLLGSAAAVVSAASHVPITREHLGEAPYIGVLFVALEVVCVALAVLLLRSDTRRVWLAATGVGASAVAAYVLSRAFTLPQIADDRGDWSNPLGVVAVTAELVLAGVGLVALARRAPRPSAPRRGSGLAAALVLLVGLSATVQAAGAAEGHDMPTGAMQGMKGMGGSTHDYWASVGGGRFASDGVVRTYYLSADEVAWNYAPLGHNAVTGKPFDDVADVFVKRGPNRIGSTYRKCLYHGYTDGTFRHRQERPASQRYLGLLGPVIRAEVGDTIKVVFRNTCSFPTSVHPHGVFYAKSSEGAPYADGTKGGSKADDAVRKGHKHTYVWKVPARAGPGPGDGSSVMWMYHSHTDEVADTYAGLMGPMEITRSGMARADGSPRDVDTEVFENFSVMNENESPYLQQNVDEYAEPPTTTPPSPGEPDPSADDEGFEESNLMHSINGYVYGNQPMVTVRRGAHVRWYIMSMGTEVDLHTPHWHGNDVTSNGMRMDVVSLLPAGMVTADMVPDNPGTWLFHCHVNDHIAAGMITRYRVVD
jgi:hephaestin